MKLYKKFLRFCQKLILKIFNKSIIDINQSDIIRTEIELLEKEIFRIQEDQKVILSFCRETLMTKVKQIDILSKNILLLDDKVVNSNEILTQHAEVINNFLEKYREHLMDTAAHTYSDEEIPVLKKERKDN